MHKVKREAGSKLKCTNYKCCDYFQTELKRTRVKRYPHIIVRQYWSLIWDRWWYKINIKGAWNPERVKLFSIGTSLNEYNKYAIYIVKYNWPVSRACDMFVKRWNWWSPKDHVRISNNKKAGVIAKIKKDVQYHWKQE